MNAADCQGKNMETEWLSIRGIGIKPEHLFESESLEKIRRKLSLPSDELFFDALAEAVKFIYLASLAPHSLFFPGNQTVDDVWHCLLLESSVYQKLESRLGLPVAVSHSGISYEDYTNLRNSREIHEEQLSWLANYVNLFGPIRTNSIDLLPMAHAISDRLQLSLEDLNTLGFELAASDPQTLSDEQRFRFLGEYNNNHRILISRNPLELGSFLRMILRGSRLSPELLESIYCNSTALGFTAAQHFAAVERLSQATEWRLRNLVKWEQISRSNALVGLATTHLKARSKILKGELGKAGITITGKVGWVSGIGIFDYLIIGFEWGDEIKFAVIDFPDALDFDNDFYKISFRKLSCMNGSATGEIEFLNLPVSESQILDAIPLSLPNQSRKTDYLNCDVGIGMRALEECRALLLKNGFKDFQQTHEELTRKLEQQRKADPSLEAQAEKHRIIESAINFLVILSGGAALDSGHLASELNQERILLNVAGQTQPLKVKKCLSLV